MPVDPTAIPDAESEAAPSDIFEEFDPGSMPPSAKSKDKSSSVDDASKRQSSSSEADLTGRDAVSERVTQLTSVVLSLAPIFGPVFMRGVLAFAVWWTTFVMVVTSGFGIIYYEYFAISMTGC